MAWGTGLALWPLFRDCDTAQALLESLEVSGVSGLVALCVQPHEQAQLCSSSSDSQGWGAGLAGVLLSWLAVPFLLLMAKI